MTIDAITGTAATAGPPLRVAFPSPANLLPGLYNQYRQHVY
jgi:hypothetical protein